MDFSLIDPGGSTYPTEVSWDIVDDAGTTILSGGSPSGPHPIGNGGLACGVYSCDIDDITNAVAFADYSSCDGKATGGICTPVCRPGTDRITNVSQPIHLVCDADGDFVHDIALTGAVVANVARLNASLSNSTDVQVATGGSSTGSFVLPTDAVLLKTSNPI